MGPTAPVPQTSQNAASSAATAIQNNSFGVGFSGGGFLIFYFTGVVAVLKALGIVNDSTKLAGSSSGAINSASTCAGLSYQQQFAANSALANVCREKMACRGFLGQAANKQIEAALPNNVAERCKGRLFIAVTEAKAGSQPDPGALLSGFSSKAEVLAALQGSTYIPYFSGPQPVVFQGKRALYDGGFSYRLPCPPGVSYCLRVWHLAPTPEEPLDLPSSALTKKLNDSNYGFLAMLQGIGFNEKDKAANAYLPLNPTMQPVQSPEIYPGLSGKLKIPAEMWNNLSLDIPNSTVLVAVYDQGREDAAAWALKKGLATEAAVKKALAATVVQKA